LNSSIGTAATGTPNALPSASRNAEYSVGVSVASTDHCEISWCALLHAIQDLDAARELVLLQAHDRRVDLVQHELETRAGDLVLNG